MIWFEFVKSFYLYKKKHPKRVMTVLVFVIVPLATGLILGYEMSGDVARAIPTVVVNHDDSEFSRTFVKYLSDSDSFQVVEEAQADSRVEEAIYQRAAFVGVIVPENFYQDLRDGKSPKILAVYDGSTLAVISFSTSAMKEIIETLKTGYMIKIYEGKIGVTAATVRDHAIPIDVTYRLLYNPSRNFRNFVLPGMLAGLIQVGISCMGAERAGELRAQNHPFIFHLKTICKWGGLGALSLGITYIEQYVLFDLPYRGTILGGALLTYLYATTIVMLGYVVGLVIKDRTFASQVAAVLVLPTTILGGYTWPALAMPPIFQQIAKGIPFYYYGNAMRDLCLSEMKLEHLTTPLTMMALFLLMEGFFIWALTKRRVRG